MKWVGQSEKMAIFHHASARSNHGKLFSMWNITTDFKKNSIKNSGLIFLRKGLMRLKAEKISYITHGLLE